MSSKHVDVSSSGPDPNAAGGPLWNHSWNTSSSLLLFLDLKVLFMKRLWPHHSNSQIVVFYLQFLISFFKSISKVLDSVNTQFHQDFLSKCWSNSTLTHTQTGEEKCKRLQQMTQKDWSRAAFAVWGHEWVYVWKLPSILGLGAIFKLCSDIWMCQTLGEPEPSVCCRRFLSHSSSDNYQPVFTSLSIPAALAISAPSDFTSCFNELLSALASNENIQLVETKPTEAHRRAEQIKSDGDPHQRMHA